MADHLEAYRSRLMSADEIAARIEPGQRLFTDDTLSQPKAILDALGRRARAGELEDVTLNTTLDIYPMPCYEPGMAGRLNGVSWFCGGSARRGVNSGCGDIMPGYYRDFSRLVRETQRVDVFCAAVSPMDRHGYFSMSTVAATYFWSPRGTFIWRSTKTSPAR